MAPHPRPPGPAEVLALADRLARDEGLPTPERHRRDRAIGLELGVQAPPAARLCAWLARVDAGATGERARSALRLARIVLLLLGTGTGTLAAAGALLYDGAGRVNVLVTLVLLVVIPGLFLLAGPVLAALAALRRPGAGNGRPLAWSLRGATERALTRHAGGAEGGAATLQAAFREPAVQPVMRWLILHALQLAAVAFQIAALLTVLALVTFTDLAFGWSSTLDPAPGTMERLVRLVATPWAGWWPAAVPDSALIQESRYFRAADGGPVDTDTARRLGGWWTFILAAIVVYGLAPRLAALAITAWCLRRACARAAIALPGAVELLERMSTPVIETRGVPAGESSTGPGVLPATPVVDLPAGPCEVVSWAAVPVEDAALLARLSARGGRPGAIHRAGGPSTSVEDRTLAADLAAHDAERPVVVVTKAWEPPLLELRDFLDELRRASGPHRMLLVLPVALEAGIPASPAPERIEWWCAELGRIGDPALRLARLPAPEAP